MLPKYDGMVRVKMQASKELTNTDINGNSSMTVDWGNQVDGTAGNVIRIQDCPEWARYMALYRMFRIQGVKMQYQPYGFNAGSTDVVSEERLAGSSQVGDPLSTATVRLAVDFSRGLANRTYNKYVGVAKSKLKTGGSTGGALTSSVTATWISVTSPQKYHAGKTTIFV